ncbi:unnamed protein product [Candidula unifasciata]|uniref:C2H2-type domain-containing protein n=1 Tax=Candidula unifasciata TaxID=100452 RepID=A0A8S3ZSJ1_9EUPU|nr:unnamed protein product [Candidula unifasciata]
MDFDSSSKFISSLAKFLQSLCNGYVEFNSGVEVIGHIYLSVDTGKKIDYILNEKVCKTDENSVTFISNSFHAQPAEKPKPPAKPAPTSDPIKPAEICAKVEEDDIIIMDEPQSKNTGTIPHRDTFRHTASPAAKAGRPLKRSFNQSFPSSHKHIAKESRSDHYSPHNSAPEDTDSLHVDNHTSSSILPSQLSLDTTITAATESDMSHLSKVFPPSFSDSVTNQGTEDRDIKPQLDSEMRVIQVKQEYEQSGHEGDDDQESFDDSQDQSTAFPGMQYDQYYGDNRRGQRPDYGQMGGMAHGEYFQGGAGPSGEGAAGDSSGFMTFSSFGRKTKQTSFANARKHSSAGSSVAYESTVARISGTVFVCEYCQKSFTTLNHYEGHKNANHLNLKPYKCEHCSKTFAHKNSLTFHRRCCQGMKQPDGLLEHLKSL